MTAEQEVRWEYDAVEVGQTGPEVTIDVTDALVSQYASTVRNNNPVYHADSSASGGNLAMPTMLLRVAPLRRHEIAANNGFVALERASENARQTPFAKCEIRWFAPVHTGDSITSFGRILEKYERRGNKFVTFRVEARNQHSQKVAEYDYTCIFEYAKGQKKPSG